MPALVAIVAASRRPSRISPRISSLRPAAYPLAVSREVMPASSAASTIAASGVEVDGVAERHRAEHELRQWRVEPGQLGGRQGGGGAGHEAAFSVSAVREAAMCRMRCRGLMPVMRPGSRAERRSRWVYSSCGRERRSSVRPLSTILPGSHDDGVLRDRPHDAEVVRDEEVGQPGVGLDVGEQLEHLGLDRHVEGARRLVADEQLGLGGQSPGDADALALAAGELRWLATEGGLAAGRRGRSARRPCPRWTFRDFSPRTAMGSATICWAVRCGSREP